MQIKYVFLTLIPCHKRIRRPSVHQSVLEFAGDVFPTSLFSGLSFASRTHSDFQQSVKCGGKHSFTFTYPLSALRVCNAEWKDYILLNQLQQRKPKAVSTYLIQGGTGKKYVNKPELDPDHLVCLFQSLFFLFLGRSTCSS